jgi:hypothetical protein
LTITPTLATNGGIAAANSATCSSGTRRGLAATMMPSASAPASTPNSTSRTDAIPQIFTRVRRREGLTSRRPRLSSRRR